MNIIWTDKNWKTVQIMMLFRTLTRVSISIEQLYYCPQWGTPYIANNHWPKYAPWIFLIGTWKTYAMSRFLWKYFQDPHRGMFQYRRIVWAFEVFITNNFNFVMNDVIFWRFNSPNFFFLIFCLIAFGGVLNSLKICDLLYKN